MKVVLDTNVWLSGIFWEREANEIITLAEDKKFQILISEDILSEIANVLGRESKFKKFMQDLKRSLEDLMRTILSIAHLIETKSKLELIKQDPKDNMILELALDGKADYIVSYDKHILNMLEFRGIKILTPQDFLELLRK